MTKQSKAESAIEMLLQIMAMLRDPVNGCPWDLQQTFASIAPHTLEEVYEVVDAIETGDEQQLQAELGDLLFQIVFYAQLGREQQSFDFAGITEAISAKLLQRHPHVFPEGSLENFGRKTHISPDEVAINWEQLKEVERRKKQSSEHHSVLNDVPLALPALLRAAKLQKRAANAGFDWTNTGAVILKVKEELAELEAALANEDSAAIDEEFGDLLFTMVNLSRHLALNPETSLRSSNRKFENRFRYMEIKLEAAALNMARLSEEELDRYWLAAKHAEKNK